MFYACDIDPDAPWEAYRNPWRWLDWPPASVHGHEMPGTDMMARKRDAITYAHSTLPRGGEVRITTTDPEALGAIHAFLVTQRGEHRAGKHSHH